MSKDPTKKAASTADSADARSGADKKHVSLDELAQLCHKVLQDENLEVSKIRPFFWTMVEAYVDRFQVFPFDASKALLSYMDLHDYPEEELRDLVKQLERQYKKKYGKSMRKSEHKPAADGSCVTLDAEIDELRETLKYAAIVGERLDDQN